MTIVVLLRLAAVAAAASASSTITTAAADKFNNVYRNDGTSPNLPGDSTPGEQHQQRLAVVVHGKPSELDNALEAIDTWPHVCFPYRLQYTELVFLLDTEGDGSSSSSNHRLQPRVVLEKQLREGGGKCFADTKIVIGAKVISIAMCIVSCVCVQ